MVLYVDVCIDLLFLAEGDPPRFYPGFAHLWFAGLAVGRWRLPHSIIGQHTRGTVTGSIIPYTANTSLNNINYVVTNSAANPYLV